MRKQINIPDEQVKDIQAYADHENWSFSQTICYLAFMGASKVAELRLFKPPEFEFDVDQPRRSPKGRIVELRTEADIENLIKERVALHPESVTLYERFKAKMLQEIRKGTVRFNLRTLKWEIRRELPHASTIPENP